MPDEIAVQPGTATARAETEAPTMPCSLGEYLLYFLRLGMFGFGGPGDRAGEVARRHDLSPARVSQLRRQLKENWDLFCGNA